MLGATLVNMLKDNYNIFATGEILLFKQQHSQYMKFDLKDGVLSRFGSIGQTLTSPIHCGALTDTNICEKEKT